MTGDAKLGMLLGVGVVIAAALVYYRPDGAQASGKDSAVQVQVQNNSRAVPLSPLPKLELPRE